MCAPINWSVVLKFIQGVRTCILSVSLLQSIPASQYRPSGDFKTTSTHTYRLFRLLKSGRYVSNERGALYRPGSFGQEKNRIFYFVSFFSARRRSSEPRILQTLFEWSRVNVKKVTKSLFWRIFACRPGRLFRHHEQGLNPCRRPFRHPV